jgi:hypothetical protein
MKWSPILKNNAFILVIKQKKISIKRESETIQYNILITYNWEGDRSDCYPEKNIVNQAQH